MPFLDEVKLSLVERNLIPAAWLQYRLDQDLRRWEKEQRPPYPHLLKQRTVLNYGTASRARVLIETGTFYGNMLRACLGHFDRLISFEIEPHFFSRAKRVFRNHSKVILVNGDSGKLLPEILGVIKEPCVFWLDAHYSCGLTGKAELETPICRELETIFAHPYHHTILIDDASEFNGTHDYPKISWVQEAARRNGYSFSLSDNIIRLV